MQHGDIDAEISANCFVDALSVKMFSVQYPAFCTVELAALLKTDGELFSCGYKGQEKRVTPLHAQDPNIYYSLTRYSFPSIFGKHQLFELDFKKLKYLFENGISYHKE